MTYATPLLSLLDLQGSHVSMPIGNGQYAVSIKGIIGAIQSAYIDSGADQTELNDLKLEILELAKKGNIEKMVYCAIVGMKAGEEVRNQ